MHILGINWVAVLAAAAAYFAIGFVIHMKLVDLKAWDAAKHTDQARLSKARMGSGIVLPLATALGTRRPVRLGRCPRPSWRASNGGLVVALVSALPALWYNWFYGTAPAWIFWVDSGHQLLGHAAVGAILAGWR